MDPHIKELYQKIRPFDTEEMYESREYANLRKIRDEIYRMVDEGPQPMIRFAIDLILDAADKEVDLICLRCFAEGYALGKQEAERDELK